MGRFSPLLNRLLASDPALSRVKMGARVTLAILVSILALIGVHLAFVPLPPISYALAIVLSIEGGVAVRDRTAADQLRTRLMGCVASLFCITLAALLEDYRLVADLVFLCVILFASLARVYGPRGFAVGMFAFISYFIGAYLKPSFAELPLAALGPLFAVAFGHLIRTYLLPDDWRRDLGEALKVIQHRVSDILERLSELSVAGTMTEKDRLDLRSREERLKDVVLMADGLLPRRSEGADASEDGPLTALSVALFDIHLAAESVIVTASEALAPRSLVKAVMRGDAALANDVAEVYASQARSPQEAESVKALLWLQRASSTLTRTVDDGALRQLMNTDGASAAKGQEKPDFSWRNPLVRAAVQITIASGIAMVFGLALSRERWFWAVLTAFLVFNNTRSRGDAAIRAVQRSVGTLLGIVIGLAAATLLAGNTAATVLLASAGVFLAFYYLQVSYAVMSFFVTIVLCLVYGLIGQLTLEVLLLRVEETMIGALAGIFVAFVIFPASTRSTVELALARWYDNLGQLLDAVREGEGRYRLIELANRLDAAYRDLTVAARPLGSAWSLVTRPGPIRQTLAVFLATSYWARILARDFADAAKPADAELLRAIDEARTALDKAAARGADCFSSKRPRHAATAAAMLPASQESAALGADMVANLLNRLYPAAADGPKYQ
ncbi:Uncharacterized membrane protein YccC [Rhizobium sp. NFR07]|uniref:FUSC family protein n=1 Tax=Rhizobium sp. NFR07 TaxID=1566262 RepID=UPI0008F048C3|nr:FUSC family protein [Rhizobium sp. NFR07]SFB42907.1 Uncharacterized membrane protein YccC [Rhizobium sp. NFR07]